ncbi:NAD(P)-dependent oxidoreductase [Zafaria sp. Z1313]|uniref:NAD(P)-dependent oxidoreductase n=1 Tax=unclassified Zafaria TaxID=2828765 RepID=UPI002E78F915|nr:NAD(P)H-binding protein [Zafaria sp. J156]MEE1620994.1 NAD(P)H-binding protein [Zafaria sp. J156]
MRIAVYGATGMVGSQIVAEALARGHEVTAVSRKGRAVEGAASAAAELGDLAAYRTLAAQHDAVVFSVPPSREGGDPQDFVDAHEAISETLVPARVFVVGGAGGTVVDGGLLVDQPGFPAEYESEARAMVAVLENYNSASGLDWTMLAPAPVIAPGERTGQYKPGVDSPVGERISTQDFAVAVLDELEEPKNRHRRFTVAN